MKVLIIIGAYPSEEYPSNSIFTHCQAKELIKQGIDVTVLEMDLRSIKKNRKLGFNKENYEGVDVFRYALPIGALAHYFPFIMQALSIKQCRRVIKLIGKPDILHFHLMESANDYRGIVEWYRQIPVIVTEHRCMWLDGNRVYKRRKERVRKLYKAAKKVICVSEIQKKYIAENYDAQTIVIPNYIENKFMYKRRKAKSPFVFVSVGEFEERKRFDLTIKAFSVFSKKHPKSHLILVGTGPLLEDMKKLAKKLKIDERIDFKGRVKNDLMPDIYNSSNVFVLPSMDESFGVVYAEAASCGLPIIATDCGGPSDIINVHNGLLIPLDNLDALVSAMEEIYNDYGKYNHQEISRDIQMRFGRETVMEQIIKCYKEI